MLIRNIDKVEKKFKCGQIIADYIVSKNIPILGFDKNWYYFSDTPLLREILEKPPVLIRVALWLEGNG